MRKNTYIFFLFISFLCAQLKNYYTYKLDSSNSICIELFKRFNLQDYQDQKLLDYLEITIKGDQNTIKDGDIFNFVFKKPQKDINKRNLSYTVNRSKEKRRWVPIISEYKPNQFGKDVQKYIILEEKDILTSPDITLNLTYNSLTDQVQIHGDQAPNISKSLRKNEKEFVDQPKYIKSEIKGTTVYYTPEGNDIGSEAITLRDIDTEGKKSKVLRTNLEVTRFFYQSKDSLFAQEVKVTDLRNNKKKQYKIWQSSSDGIIPDQLQKNGILTGDMKPLTITNYERNPESPYLKEISYKPYPLLRLSDNIYEYSDKQKPVKAFYKTKYLNVKKTTYALLGEKFSDKFIYILNEEHNFEEINGKIVLAPVKEGTTETTIRTIGDIKRVWVPAITSFIVILGFL